jgi:hypothetical protein
MISKYGCEAENSLVPVNASIVQQPHSNHAKYPEVVLMKMMAHPARRTTPSWRNEQNSSSFRGEKAVHQSV